VDRFWSKVRKDGPGGCWLWTASLCSSGYGSFLFEGRVERAHRVSWVLSSGDVPAGLCVLHHCDNRRCVNPAHLYVGTKKDNARDREERGRSNHATGLRHGRHTHPGQTAGSRNGRAKLRERDVALLLKKHFKQGRRKADLAREYGLSKTTVGHIVSGKLWPKVEGRV